MNALNQEAITHGHLEVICGPMFAGKTTELMQRIARARAEGRRVVVFKPQRDTRYATDEIVTHTGCRLNAVSVTHAREFLTHCSDYETIAIDEVHFFALDAVEPITHMLRRGQSVIVSGCDLDHFGDTFEPFAALIPLANEVLRLTGVCTRCGGLSTHSARLSGTTQRIEVGGVGQYEPRCAACFTPSHR